MEEGFKSKEFMTFSFCVKHKKDKIISAYRLICTVAVKSSIMRLQQKRDWDKHLQIRNCRILKLNFLGERKELFEMK